MNLKLEEYNQNVEKYINEDQAFNEMDEETKQHLLAKSIAKLDKYKFKVEYYYPVHYDSLKKIYVDRQNEIFDIFDPMEFRNKLKLLIDEERKAINLNSERLNITLLRDHTNDYDLFELLQSNKRLQAELMEFFGGEEASRQFLTDFSIEMVLDNNFTYKTFDEYKISIAATGKYIEDANKYEIGSLKMIKANSAINFASLSQKNLEHTKLHLDKISDTEIKAKIVMSLIKDAAFNYNKYLGFTLICDIGKLFDTSFDEICALKTKFFSSSPENYVVFILEIITNYSGPDYEELINAEMAKVRGIKNFFKSLCYYDKVKEFYDNNFQAFKFKEFFIMIFLLLFYRVNKMFDVEINFENNDIFIEETRIKLYSLDWSQMHTLKKCILIENLAIFVLRKFEYV